LNDDLKGNDLLKTHPTHVLVRIFYPTPTPEVQLD